MRIICFSDTAWNFLWQRQNHLLSRVPSDWKVLYVEPNYWKSFILNIINWFSGIRAPLNQNIMRTSMPTIPLIDNISQLRKLNNALIFHRIRHIIDKNDFRDAILLFYNPRFSFLVNRLGERMVCYEIIDDKLAFEQIPQWLEKEHEFLIEHADLITVSSKSLYTTLSTRKKEIALIGNGVDVSFFSKALTETGIPQDIINIKKPVIGYIGAVGEWIDFDLLERILKKYTGVSLVIIGWVFGKQRAEIKRLKHYSNFHFIGRRSYDVLPNYLRYFDVCIIPFKTYRLTESINPNKFYEYLCTGKPIISSALPELKTYKEVVYIANDDEQFLNYIQKALNKRNCDIEKMLDIARMNDWSAKAADFIKVLSIYSSNE